MTRIGDLVSGGTSYGFLFFEFLSCGSWVFGFGGFVITGHGMCGGKIAAVHLMGLSVTVKCVKIMIQFLLAHWISALNLGC